MSEQDLEKLLPKDIPAVKRAPEGMRTYTMFRTHDASGVSGTGIVCQGVLFANGMCANQWLVGPDPGDVVTKEWEKFLDTHVRSHPENETIITFSNKEQLVFGRKDEDPTVLTVDSIE